MKVVALETIRLNDYPSIMFLQVHTDDGLIGLGENCGFITPPTTPGLGTQLQPGLNQRSDALVRWSKVG